MLMNKFKVLLKGNTILFINKRLKWSTKNIELFTDIYGMSKVEFTKHRRLLKLPELSEKHMLAAAAFCENTGIPKKEFVKFPTLLKELSRTLEQRYLQLKEGGFTNISAEVLANYRKCVGKKISFLKTYSLIPKHINVAENFVSYVNPKPNDFPISDLTDEHSFENIHHLILTRYLIWRLNTTKDMVEQFYRIYSLQKIKSFDFLSQNFAIAEKLGFPSEKLQKYGYLLTVYPRYTKTVLTKMPTIAGMDMRIAMRRYPKLIGISPEQYIEIYNYLQKVGVQDTAIQKSMNIFSLSPETVKARIEEINAVPELRVLLNNPRCLSLVIHHNQARSRLSFLQDLQLKCASTTVLSADHNTFNTYLREGKDILNTKEILLFMKILLKTDSNLLEKNLRKHPNYRYVPLIEIERSYKFLRKLKFSDQSIIDVVQILLYPSYKIEQVYEKIKKLKSVGERKLSPIEKLNLILYFMEKEHHFTGNGIWTNDKEHV